MTSEERQRRNRGIIAAYCAGNETAEGIAKRFCVTSRHVHNIAARAGVSMPRGRPAALPHASDETLAQYRRYRRHHGAEMAREMVSGVSVSRLVTYPKYANAAWDSAIREAAAQWSPRAST